MKVYLASKFSTQAEVREKAEELRQVGITVTSRWLDEVVADVNADTKDYDEEYLQKHAEMDIMDIVDADVLVLFTVEPNEATKRGGRHFESGVMYGMTLAESGISSATNIPLELHVGTMTVGPRENIFHHMPSVPNFATWEEAKAKLILMSEEYERLSSEEATDISSSRAN